MGTWQYCIRASFSPAQSARDTSCRNRLSILRWCTRYRLKWIFFGKILYLSICKNIDLQLSDWLKTQLPRHSRNFTTSAAGCMPRHACDTVRKLAKESEKRMPGDGNESRNRNRGRSRNLPICWKCRSVRKNRAGLIRNETKKFWADKNIFCGDQSSYIRRAWEFYIDSAMRKWKVGTLQYCLLGICPIFGLDFGDKREAKAMLKVAASPRKRGRNHSREGDSGVRN